MRMKCIGVCVSVHVCTCVCGCTRMTLIVMPDKLFVPPLTNGRWTKQPKHTFFCLDLTHCQHATPITHKSECYQCRDCERRATLSWCTWESLSGSLQPCGFHCLWEQQGRNCALAQPYLWWKWKAGAGCCCAMGPWVIFSECRLLTFEEESSRWGGGLWVQRRHGQSG